MHASFAKTARNAIPLHAVAAGRSSPGWRACPYLKASGFAAKEGELRLVPGPGRHRRGGAGPGQEQGRPGAGGFSEKLPDGIYRLGEVPDFCGGAKAALAWALGLYLRPLQKAEKART